MTVTQSFSLSLTYTSLRMYLPQTAPARTQPPSDDTTREPTGDTVMLSPEAATGPSVHEAPDSPPAGETLPSSETPQGSEAAPEASSAPPSRVAQRAESLLDALDRDHDGAVTKDEFVDRAIALLRRAGARHQHHGVHGEGDDRRGDGHEGHGIQRLEQKLDRLFERVDSSGDGNVDQEELTEALAKVTRERQPDTTETPAPANDAESQKPASGVESQTAAAAMSYTSVTVVIAVKQYTSVAAMQA